MMTKFTLKPLDDSQKSVEIPIGKTTIGRGPFLGCADKKVSRNHAVLEVKENGEVYLTPTHVNPCFYQPTADNPGTILKKDKPHKLEDGDSFSLLPRAFRYMLVAHNADAGCHEKENPAEAGEKLNGLAEGKPKEIALEVNDVPKDDQEKVRRPETPESEESKDAPAVPEVKDTSDKGSEKKADDVADNPTSELNGDEEEEDDDDDDEEETPREKASSAKKEESVKKNEDKEETVIAKEESGDEKTVKTKPEEVKDDEEESGGTSRTLPGWLADMSEQNEDENSSAKPSKLAKTEKKTPNRRAAAQKTNAVGRKKKQTERRKNSDSEFRGEYSRQASSGRSSRTNRQTRQGLSLEDFIASDDDEWQSDESEPRQKRRRRRRRRDDDSGSDWEMEHKKTKKVSVKFDSGSGSESGSDWGASSQKKRKAKNMPKGRRKQSKRTKESDLVSEEEEEGEEEEEEEVKSEPEKHDKRIPCTYGKKCYRKNQNHLDQFCHPGDSDYESGSEAKQKSESDDDEKEQEGVSKKKECPYGADCFRKNPQHKKDFKHTKKVRPQREAAKLTGKKAKGKDGEPDSYDLNESLLNDEESDEYKPVDSGSDFDSSQDLKRPSEAEPKQIPKAKKAKRV